VKVSGISMLLLVSITPAVAGLSTDPFVVDPQFYGGATLEDRFAAIVTTNDQSAQKIVVLQSGPVVPGAYVAVAGLVPAAYSNNPANGYFNLGMVAYGDDGARTPWGGTVNPYNWLYFDNHYIDYPNSNTPPYSAVRDMKLVGNHLFQLVDSTDVPGNRDVKIVVFENYFGLLAQTPIDAFVTGLDETGAALVPYSYNAGTDPNPDYHFKLIAIATYTTGSGIRIVTAKRFSLDFYSGALAVDTTFGPNGNGAIDYSFPACHDGAPCSTIAKAAVALRADTATPTIYIAGDHQYLGTDWDIFVMAIDGATGNRDPSFGNTVFGGFQSLSYNNPNSTSEDRAVAIAATTTGAASTDRLYLAATAAQHCAPSTVVSRLQAGQGGQPWFVAASRTFAGDASPTCSIAVQTFDTPYAMTLAGGRLAIAGERSVSGAAVLAPYHLPELAILRIPDLALTDFRTFTPTHPDGSSWDSAGLRDIVATDRGFIAAGVIYGDGNHLLFGTSAYVSDRIFGDDLQAN